MSTPEQDFRDKLSTTQKELTGKIEGNYKELRDKIDVNSHDLAELKGTVKTAKLIAILATFIGVAASGLGIQKLLQDRSDLEQALFAARAALRGSAISEQTVMLDRLDAEFGQIESLDALRENTAALDRIRKIAATIEGIAERLKPEERSTYYLVGKALEPYLAGRCDAVIETLDRVNQPERYQFVYAYMRGACLLRLEKLKEADEWLSLASRLNNGRRAALALSGQGVTKLFLWRVSKDRTHLDQAIESFESAMRIAPDLPPVYFNLACAYAQLNDYAKTTAYLKLPREKRIRTVDAILQRIREDLSRPSDRFLAEYVRSYLKVAKPQDDPRWADEVRGALKL